MLGCFAYDVSPDVGCYETWGAEGCGAAVGSEKSDQLLSSNQTTKGKLFIYRQSWERSGPLFHSQKHFQLLFYL